MHGLNLKQINDNLENLIIDLHDFDMSSGYQELVHELEDNLALLKLYFGMYIVKDDICEFHKGEEVVVHQDEGGAYMYSLDHSKWLEITEFSPDELFENWDW